MGTNSSSQTSIFIVVCGSCDESFFGGEYVSWVSQGCRKGVLLESRALGKPTIKEETYEEVYGGLSADLTRRGPIGQANLIGS